MKKINEKTLNILLILSLFIWLSMMSYFLITKQYDEIRENLIILFVSFISGVIYSKFKMKK